MTIKARMLRRAIGSTSARRIAPQPRLSDPGFSGQLALRQLGSTLGSQWTASSPAIPPSSPDTRNGSIAWVDPRLAPKPPSEDEMEAVNQELSDATPTEILSWAGKAGPVAMSSSFGAQAAILLHMANKVLPGLPVICVDTGYLPPETYRYIEELKECLDLNLVVVNNTEWSPARMEAIYGKLWEQEDSQAHKLYGSMRKAEPLEDALAALDPQPVVLLSGVRASQTKARANMPTVTRQPDGKIKVLPLLRMSDQEVQDYFEEHSLPQHPLVAQGYVSIGDWHSSRALLPGESAADARKTRFGGKFEECGLHVTSHTRVEEPEQQQHPDGVMDIISTTEMNLSTGFATHLVKKRLEDGDMCRKCKDVQRKLEEDGTMAFVGGVSIADVTDASSDGMRIAEHFDEKKAPFFVVKEPEKPWRVIYSYGQWKKTMTKASKAIAK